MVKAVVGDEAQLQLAEERIFESVVPQIGLLIGKLSLALDRGFIFDLVPTPLNDAGEPACSLPGTSSRDDKKKGSKSKQLPSDAPVLCIDNDWVAEHARQVSRMLVGGVMVIGIYVYVSDSTFKNSSTILCQTLKSVSVAAPLVSAIHDERLLVHICSSPRRWNCRTFMVSSSITPSSLRPCDLKMGKVLSYLLTFKCIYHFELRLPVGKEGLTSVSAFNDILRDGMSCLARDLTAAMALVDGKLIDNEELSTPDGRSYDLELLLPFMKNTPSEAFTQKDIVGVILWKGSVCSYAYANGKESVSQAIADIKDDIIRTLRSRLDIICEAEDDVDASDDTARGEVEGKPNRGSVTSTVLRSLREKCVLSLPRRVFVPWVGGIYLCDYLQRMETREAVKEHCAEIFSMEVPLDMPAILEPETEAAFSVANGFWEIAVPENTLSIPAASNRERDAVNNQSDAGLRRFLTFNLVTAAFFVFLSILFGLVVAKWH